MDIYIYIYHYSDNPAIVSHSSTYVPISFAHPTVASKRPQPKGFGRRNHVFKYDESYDIYMSPSNTDGDTRGAVGCLSQLKASFFITTVQLPLRLYKTEARKGTGYVSFTIVRITNYLIDRSVSLNVFSMVSFKCDANFRH